LPMMKQERIKALAELLTRDPNDSFSRYALAVEYTSEGNTDQAIVELKEVIKRDAAYVAAYRQLGQVYLKLNKTKEAKKFYRKGIDLAKQANDLHAKQEMEEELEDIEDEW
jgi:Tfp pilus assembly protein PilF